MSRPIARRAVAAAIAGLVFSVAPVASPFAAEQEFSA